MTTTHRKRASARRTQTQRGHAMVEGALSMVVFLMFIFGTMDFARAVYIYNSVTFAAQEATRYAIVHGNASAHPATATEIQTYAGRQVVKLGHGAVTASTTWTPNNRPGSLVRVQVNYQFRPAFPFLLGRTITLRSASQMVIAQ